MRDTNGCGDHGCHLHIGMKTGQMTNGGCRCLEGIETNQRIRILKKLASLNREVRVVRGAVLALHGKDILTPPPEKNMDAPIVELLRFIPTRRQEEQGDLF
jgi:hypothetical protein